MEGNARQKLNVLSVWMLGKKREMVADLFYS